MASTNGRHPEYEHAELVPPTSSLLGISEEHRMRRRCRAIKEELMRVTWAPNRHVNWCLDVQEMEELLVKPAACRGLVDMTET
jgi:hypothetical protein